MPKIFAIIPAAGRGGRFCSDSPKQFLRFAGISPVESVVSTFLSVAEISAVCCVVPERFLSVYSKLFGGYGERLFPPVAGGRTRKGSVKKCLEAVSRFSPDYVLIHDAARPNLTKQLVEDVIVALQSGAKAVVPGVVPVDSVRFCGKSVDRSKICLIQTPQGFDFQTIFTLHQKYEDLEVSDDAALCDLENIDVKVIKGDPQNMKITYRTDIKKFKIKTGFGIDVHAFTDSRKLFLMGVEIEDHLGLEGISDADVGIHSLVDAILGALGLGSIGEHFPPSDAKFKNCDSKKFLDYCTELLEKHNSEIVNCDITIVCETPKISEYAEKMKQVVAKHLRIFPRDINIKGKTTEGLGFTGRKEGIAVYSMVTIRCFH